MKLAFAAPANFLPSLPTAFVSQVSLLHFCMKLVFAAPARGLPSFAIALLSQVSCAVADPAAAKTNMEIATRRRFIVILLLRLALTGHATEAST